jgi:protein SCO1
VVVIGGYGKDKKFEDVRSIEHAAFVEAKEKVIIVYFGYVGCVSVCQPLLEELSKVYDSLGAVNRGVGVYFVNIAEGDDGYELSKTYMSAINPNFKASKIRQDERSELYKSFNVYFARSLFDDTSFDHTSYLYVLKHDKEGLKLLSRYQGAPLDGEVLKSDLVRLLEVK